MEKAAQGKTGDAARAGAAEPEVYQMSDYEAAKKLGVSAAEPEVYQMSGYEAAKKLGVSIEAGLDEAAVRLSKSAHGKNALSRQKKAGLFKRIVDAVTEPMMLILLFAFAVTFSVNCVKAYHNEGFDYPECVGIFAAIVISVCITLFMEGRSAKAFEALRSFSANILVKVLRGGAWLPLPAADLAVGDVVEFAVGDKIPADCRVLKTDEFEVDESPLTGESYPVQKDAARVFSRGAFPPLAERVNMAYAGCFVTAGSALALVTAVGDKTEIGGIAQSLKDAGDALTPLQQKLSRLGKTIAIIGAAAAALVFTLQLVQLIVTKSVTFDSVQNIFITAIVLIVAAVPEGLPTIVAISFALNVIKMAREHALVKKMAACETVGGVSVICSDKTGTLTENKMTVEVIRGQGSGVRGQGPMDSVGAVDIPPESEELGIRSDQRWIGLQRSNPSVIPHSSLLTPNLTRNICINSTADVSPDFKTGEYAFIGSPTECALLVAYEKSGPKKSYAQVRKEARIVRVFPFSGELKRMTTVVDSGQRAADGGQFAVLCKGAPETVLELCEISAHEKGRILNEISAYQRQAKRVIAFAHSAIVGADALAGPPRMHSVRPIEPAKASSPTGESVYSGKFRGVAALPGDGCGDTKREARSARQGFESLPFETSVPVPPTFPPGKVSLQQYFPPREVPNPEISGQWSVASGRLKEDKSHFRIPNPESRIPNPESRIPNPASFRREDVEHNLIFDGYAVISDPIRKDVYAAVAACKGAGIEVKMLTGDNAATAAAVARELGILPGALSTVHCVDARDIDQMSDAELAERLSSIKVVARNTPATKLRIVNALKSRGEVVAVTGDGVNDAPAVKAADVGIAMGRSGTEVCKEAADIVILNDSFSTVVSAVKWGRGIYENFQRFILFQLTVNFSAVAVTVAYILLGLGAPFNALQLLWINIIMDGPPALTLGLEPVGEGLLTRKPVGRNDHIITKKMAYRIFVNVAFITVLLLTQGITNFMGIEASKERTFIFALFIIFQLFNAFNARELGRQSILKTLTRNKPMLIVMAITFVLQIVIVQSAGAFGTVPLSFSDWLKIFAAGFSVIAFNELYKALVRRMPRRAATRRGHPAKKAGGLSHEVHNPIGG